MRTSTLSSHGSLKGNKLISKPYIYGYAPSFDSATTALINRMISAGETPVASQREAIDVTIKALKAANLFDTQWDVLVVTHGHGIASTKMNWIKNANNASVASGTPLYIENLGYNGQRDSSLNGFLNADYNPATDGVLFQQDDACMGFKINITPLAINHGGWDSGTKSKGVFWYGSGYNINGTAPITGNNGGLTKGYNALSRNNSANFDVLVNSIKSTKTKTSEAIESTYSFVFYLDGGGWMDGEVELYFYGKSITQANFIIFQGIMDNYFSSI
jgi:hypothetical protein